MCLLQNIRGTVYITKSATKRRTQRAPVQKFWNAHPSSSARILSIFLTSFWPMSEILRKAISYFLAGPWDLGQHAIWRLRGVRVPLYWWVRIRPSKMLHVKNLGFCQRWYLSNLIIWVLLTKLIARPFSFMENKMVWFLSAILSSSRQNALVKMNYWLLSLWPTTTLTFSRIWFGRW